MIIPGLRLFLPDRYRLALSIPFILLLSQVGNAQLNRAPKRDPASTGLQASPLQLVGTYLIPNPNLGFQTKLVFRSLLERLQESSALRVTEEKEMRRKDAADLAKRDADSFVVWLQLDIELGGKDVTRDSENTAFRAINPACLYVSYEVFAPRTGKTIKQGHEYQPGYQDRCAGGVYHTTPYPDHQTPTRSTPELDLKQAAREAADHIMAALDVPVPRKHP